MGNFVPLGGLSPTVGDPENKSVSKSPWYHYSRTSVSKDNLLLSLSGVPA